MKQSQNPLESKIFNVSQNITTERPSAPLKKAADEPDGKPPSTLAWMREKVRYLLSLGKDGAMELIYALQYDVPDAVRSLIREFDPTVPGRRSDGKSQLCTVAGQVEVLELRKVLSGATAQLLALEDQLRSFPSDTDLAAQISASEARIALLKAELATATANAPLPIDAVEWPNGTMAFPGEGNRGSLAINPAGTTMVTTSQNMQPIVTDIATGKELMKLIGHNAMVTSAAFSPDGTIIATASHDQNGRIFDARTGELKDTIAFPGLVSAVTFMSDGKAVWNVNGAGARIYDLKTKQFTAEFPGGSPVAPVFSRDGSTAFFADENVVGRKDMISSAVQSFNPGIDRIKVLDIDPSGKTIAIGSVNGTVKFLDAVTMQTIGTIPGGNRGSFNGGKFDGNDRFIGFYDNRTNTIYVKGASWGSVTVAEQWLSKGWPVNPVGTQSTLVYWEIVDRPQDTPIVRKVLHPASPTVGRPASIVNADLTAEETEKQKAIEKQTNKRNTEQSIVEVKVIIAGEEKAAAAPPAVTIPAAPSKAHLDAVFTEIATVTPPTEAPAGAQAGSTAEPSAPLTLENSGLSEASLQRLTGARSALLPGAGGFVSINLERSGVLELQIDSPYDETWLVQPAGVTHLTHPGGAKKLVAFHRQLSDGAFINWAETNPANLQEVFELYADAGRTVMLDRIVFQGDRATGRFTQVTAERPAQPKEFFAPQLQILRTEKAAVTVAFSSPYAQAVLQIAGGGDFGTTKVRSDGAVTMRTATLTIDGRLPSGTYRMELLDRTGGTVLKKMDLQWDALTKRLSFGGPMIFTPQATVVNDGVTPLSALIQRAQGEEASQRTMVVEFLDHERALGNLGGSSINANVLDTPEGKSLIPMQRSAIVSLAAQCGYAYQWSRDELWQRFLVRNPEWQRQISAEIEGSTRQRNLIEGRSVAFSQGLQAMGGYDDSVGRAMEAAMNVMLLSRIGGDTEGQMQILRNIVRNEAAGIAASLSMFGLRLPDDNECIEAACEILELRLPEYLAMRGYMDEVIAKQWWAFSHPGSSVAGSGAASPTSTQLESALRMQQILAAQSGLPMYGADGVTVIGMGGQLYATVPTAAQAAANTSVVASGVSDGGGLYGAAPESLGTFAETNLTDMKLPMAPGKQTVRSFTLSEPAMVNAWMMGAQGIVSGQFQLPPPANFSIRLAGGPNNIDYASGRAMGSGDSISSVLPAGTYTLTILDATVYPSTAGMTDVQRAAIRLPDATVNLTAKRYATQNIEGRISIDGSEKVMPVSIRVAEFEASGKRNLNYDGSDATRKTVNTLDPKKPVWVVVHGMDSYEDAGGIESIARELAAYGSSMQIVTVNWSEAAQALLKSGNDAPWTKVVGEWTASQLIAAGFHAESINVAAHSHGTYVAFAIANEIIDLQHGAQINAIVALDPAGNVPALSGFDDSIIKFSAVTRNSIAIEGSWIAGSNRLAGTADVAFQIDSASTYSPLSEHGLPMTTFANILRSERLLPGQFPKALTLFSIMTLAEQQPAMLEKNVFREFYEGIINVETQNATDSHGNYKIGIPTRVESRLKDAHTDDVRTIANPDTTIMPSYSL